MTHRLAWLALPFACSIAFAACGGGDDSDDSNGSQLDGGGSGDATVRGDGASGDGATDSGPPFTPLDFGSRLVLWLDSSDLVTTSDAGIDASPFVSAWGDRSPAHNDAKPFLGNATELAGDTEAGANGRPMIHFNGASTLAIPETPSLVWSTGDFSLYVVFRDANVASAFALVAGKYDTTTPFPGPNVYANFFMPAASTRLAGRLDSTHYAETDDGGFNDDLLRVVGMRRSGTRLELRVDGISTVNDEAGTPDGAPIDVTAPDASFFVGGRPTPGAFLVGDMVEVIGVQGTLSDGEVVDLETYLAGKYGL